ncbi:MAG: hypothetical protein V1494_03155 [Candidatus Diapherotrites archaeon]
MGMLRQFTHKGLKRDARRASQADNRGRESRLERLRGTVEWELKKRENLAIEQKRVGNNMAAAIDMGIVAAVRRRISLFDKLIGQVKHESEFLLTNLSREPGTTAVFVGQEGRPFFEFASGLNNLGPFCRKKQLRYFSSTREEKSFEYSARKAGILSPSSSKYVIFVYSSGKVTFNGVKHALEKIAREKGRKISVQNGQGYVSDYEGLMHLLETMPRPLLKNPREKGKFSLERDIPLETAMYGLVQQKIREKLRDYA